MASTNVRIDPETHAALRDLAEQQHRPIGRIVTDAVDIYREEMFWREMEAALSRLKADPVAWKDYQDEIALWDAMAGDGLENEESWVEDDEEGHGEAS